MGVRCRGAAGAWAAVVALAVVPVSASAVPVLNSDSDCLRPGQTADGQQIAPALRVAGSGFTPGATVSLTRGGQVITGVAAQDGTFGAELSVADLLSSGVPRPRVATVVARDDAGAATAVRIKVAPLAFTASPARATPSSVVRFRFSGFTPGRVIHAHYVYAGRVRANVPMAQASAPCGIATVRRIQLPVDEPEVGSWTVQFDNRARYSPRARPRIVAAIGVYAAQAR